MGHLVMVKFLNINYLKKQANAFKYERRSIMKKNVFKKLAGLATVISIIVSATACGSSDKKSNADTGSNTNTDAALTFSGEKKVIKFFHRFPDEPYNSFIESKIAEYEANHPDIDIVITSAQNDPYKEKIKVVIAMEDCPDIFFSWCGEFTERFIREDLVLDLIPYLEADKEWKDSLLPVQLAEYTTKDGMVYGIPFRLDGKMFFYNKEIFDAQGLSIPTTWDKFIAACDKLQTAGITPIAYGNQDLWPSAHYIGTLNQMLVSNEVRAVDYEPATGEFTDQGYEEALTYYQELIPYFNKGANGMTHDMARTTFSQGQAAMIYVELVEIPYIKQENPDLNYGMFNFPAVEGAGDPAILTGSPEGFVVSSKTEYPDECVEFLKWFLGPEVGAEQAQEIGWFNGAVGVDKAITDESLKEAYNVISGAESMGAWFDSSLYSTVCDEYLTAVSELTNKELSPADAMAKIQKTAKEAQTLSATESTEE